jgi:hypothetical protein
MLATIVTVLTSGFIAVGVVNEVVLPVGEYAIEKGTEAYGAGKELIIGTEAD